jgi:hypothetical protein
MYTYSGMPFEKLKKKAGISLAFIEINRLVDMQYILHIIAVVWLCTKVKTNLMMGV